MQDQLDNLNNFESCEVLGSNFLYFHSLIHNLNSNFVVLPVKIDWFDYCNTALLQQTVFVKSLKFTSNSHCNNSLPDLEYYGYFRFSLAQHEMKSNFHDHENSLLMDERKYLLVDLCSFLHSDLDFQIDFLSSFAHDQIEH